MLSSLSPPQTLGLFSTFEVRRFRFTILPHSRLLPSLPLPSSSPLLPAMSPSSSSGGSIPLHHCKFVDYTPSSVTAIAFPPIPLPTRRRATTSSSSTSSTKEPEMGIMAVGKGNGDVEIFRWVERSEGGQGWVLYRVRSSSTFKTHLSF